VGRQELVGVEVEAHQGGHGVAPLEALEDGGEQGEEPLRRLEHKPSDYVRKHLKFTPFPGEDVGWMINAAGEELFMFSTDYPHPEGGKDPLAKFEETLTDVGEDAKDRFYYSNMAELLQGTSVAA